jgi:hypothetical protein
MALPKSSKTKLSTKFTFYQPLVKYGLLLRTIQKHNEERLFLNASHFDFRADHSTKLQCMRLAD